MIVLGWNLTSVYKNWTLWGIGWLCIRGPYGRHLTVVVGPIQLVLTKDYK